MKLYSNGLGAWAGTQAEAKILPGTTRQIDVPVDKPSLLEFLNDSAVMDVSCLPEQQDVSTSTVLETSVINIVASASKARANRWDIMDAAQSASLQDLQHVVYIYLNRIDDELALKKRGKSA